MTSWLKQLLFTTHKHILEKAPWLDGYSPIFIYGTGTMAQDIQIILTNKGLPVYGFVDHLERANPFLKGFPVLKPEGIQNVSKAGREPIVILGIHNYQANVPKIIKRLMANGISRIISTVELYDYFSAELGGRYWLTSRDFYLPLGPVLEECQAMWSDDVSRDLFRSIMEFRLSGNALSLPQPDLVNPYHPSDVPEWKKPLRFVDCGAFDGDTLADLIHNDVTLEAIAAFEPDLANFSELSKFISQQSDKLPNAQLWPCGVYSSTTQLTFTTGLGMASNISKSGTTVVQCAAIDDVLPNFAPNLIKMDIEGAEYDAILGARNTIASYLPGLAISLYHRPEHIWQLPFLIENIAPKKYQFFMRSHAMNDFELVLYAIPS